MRKKDWEYLEIFCMKVLKKFPGRIVVCKNFLRQLLEFTVIFLEKPHTGI